MLGTCINLNIGINIFLLILSNIFFWPEAIRYWGKYISSEIGCEVPGFFPIFVVPLSIFISITSFIMLLYIFSRSKPLGQKKMYITSNVIIIMLAILLLFCNVAYKEACRNAR